MGADLTGDPGTPIHRPVPAGTADPYGITFAGDARYLAKAIAGPIGAVIVGVEVGDVPAPKLAVADPRSAFGRVLALMSRPLPLNAGVHPTAAVDPTATIEEGAQIGAFVVVEQGAVVRSGAKVYAQCYIGEGSVVEQDAVLYPRVTLYQQVRVGKRCIVHSGAVIGADGFGFVWDGQRRHKIPQVGNVELEDDVEIGANTCIDRATAGTTRIGRGTKIDDLVMVGHNCVLGENNVLAAQVGLGGSSEVGSRVVMGGQAALSDHVTVGDDVVLGGRSGVITDLKQPGEYMGLPPVPVTQAIRALSLTQRLPELFQRLRALEAKINKP